MVDPGLETEGSGCGPIATGRSPLLPCDIGQNKCRRLAKPQGRCFPAVRVDLLSILALGHNCLLVPYSLHATT